MYCKMIVLDIDETLLNSNGGITDRNKEVIGQALSQGIKVVLCSGRTHNAVTEYTNELNIKGSNQYIITNGGAIIENMQGKILYKKMLDNKLYRSFFDFVQMNKLHYNVVDEFGNTYTSTDDWIDKYTVLQAFENDNGLYLRKPNDLPSDFKIIKAIINGTKAELDNVSEKVHEKFGRDYFVVRTGDGFLEISSKEGDKGTAIISLADRLNIDLKNVLAIGDGENDLAMLKVAGKKIAMGNAVPAIKSIADFITADNNNSGVAIAIEKYAF
ncbi:Cof-type HAD-IIB family hydrolase [Companilactobacillus nantensis]|nr:Cof-type HAD-IIB family hydrolase [Companilactobacillus nantensis]GEO62931.1 hydrolase [Companilactobacillus nantensis]